MKLHVRGRNKQRNFKKHNRFSRPLHGFTLTELLVVITIIAILAALITGAAINALNRAKQVAITQEIMQLANSLEDFKNTYGAYPPNGMSPLNVRDYSNDYLVDLHADDFVLMFKKAFPRSQEPEGLIRHLAGNVATGLPGKPSDLPEGMRGSEALMFWLGGFSEDTQYPISGPGGPSFATNVPNPIEDLTTRNRRYEFDLGRLGPRDADGAFYDVDNGGDGRYITYEVNMNGNLQTRRINLWRYNPSGSNEPLVYFDASRHRAQVQVGAGGFVNNYDPWFYKNADGSVLRYALKELNQTGGSDRVEFVNQGKFQILHCGIDDLWGDFGETTMWIGNPGASVNSTLLLFPTGPFLGDVADTVSNFFSGPLADEQE